MLMMIMRVVNIAGCSVAARAALVQLRRERRAASCGRLV